MQEWITWNLYIGIAHLYLYDHDSADETRELLTPFIELGLVTLIVGNYSRRDPSVQAEMYMHCVGQIQTQYDWIYVGDSDEFLVFTDGTRCIGDFLCRYPNASAVQVQWANYVTSGQLSYDPSLLVLERYVHRTRYVGWTKAIHNSNFITPELVWIHGSKGAAHIPKPIDVTGKTVKETPDFQSDRFGYNYSPVYEPLRINHYHSKSFEEYLMKVARGQSNAIYYNIKRLLEWEAEVLIEDGAALPHVPAMKELLGRG